MEKKLKHYFGVVLNNEDKITHCIVTKVEKPEHIFVAGLPGGTPIRYIEIDGRGFDAANRVLDLVENNDFIMEWFYIFIKYITSNPCFLPFEEIMSNVEKYLKIKIRFKLPIVFDRYWLEEHLKIAKTDKKRSKDQNEIMVYNEIIKDFEQKIEIARIAEKNNVLVIY